MSDDAPRSKYAKRLDRSRNFGTNHPPEEGVFYWQDGVPFDHEGVVVDAVAESLFLAKLSAEDFAKKLPLAKKKAPSASPPKPPAPARKAPAGEDGDETEGQGTKGEESDDGINLTLWLQGEESYPYPVVQAAIKKRFSVHKTSRRDAVLFLVEDEKVVPIETLSADHKKLIGIEP